MHSKVIIIVTQFMFLGINIIWALLRAHFNPRLTAWAKMSLSRAQNIFMPANINSDCFNGSWLPRVRSSSYGCMQQVAKHEKSIRVAGGDSRV